ncbi:MAG TPA: S8 family serine peptidase [Candidatus Kapabacteria bacterium]|nr:S8 family serine peptidase [Candidatus Kapabacteria bacterium]
MDQFNQGIAVAVYSGEMAILSDAQVTLADASGTTTTAIFDSDHGVYLADLNTQGAVTISVTCDGFEPQSRTVAGLRLARAVPFYLGRPGDSYTWQDGARVPYQSTHGQIAVLTHDWDAVRHDLRDHLGGHLVNEEGHERKSVHRESGPEVKRATVNVVRISPLSPHSLAAGAAGHGGLLAKLRAHPKVSAAGPVFRYEDDQPLLFTNRVSITFHADVSTNAALGIIASAGLENGRLVKGTQGTFSAWADPDVGEEINALLERLMAMPEVESASAEIHVPLQLEALNPSDFLWPAVWDRIRVRCPEAWEFINNNVGGSGFGDPNVVIGVVDGGVISDAGGVPLHEELRGQVPGGVSTTLTAILNPTHSVITVRDSNRFVAGNVVDVGLETQKLVHRVTLVGPGNIGTLEIDALFTDAPVGTEVMLNGAPATRTWMTARTAAATATVAVTAAAGFVVGDRVSIGSQTTPAAGTAVAEEVTILNIVGNTLTTTPVVARDLNGTIASHPVAAPVDSRRKTTKLFDAQLQVYNHNNFPALASLGGDDHGLCCATIATATANNGLAGGVANGLAGAAGHARLVSIKSAGSRADYIDAFEWITGVDSLPGAGAATPWPDMLHPGADVTTCSLGIGRYISTVTDRTPVVDEALNHLTRRGRGNRGTLMFFSAGNDDIAQESTRWSAHARIFSVAALEMKNVNNVVLDTRASYSCYSRPAAPPLAAVPVTICTPSGVSNLKAHNPPFNYWMLAGCIPGTGNRISRPTFTTQLRNPIAAARTERYLLANVAVGAASITVDSTAGIANGDWLLIGLAPDGASGPVPPPNTRTMEWVRVDPGLPIGLNVIPLAAGNRPLFAQFQGTRVVAGTLIDVVNAAPFAVGDWIQLGDPSALGSEAVNVQAVDAVNQQLRVSGPFNTYLLPTNVHRGAQDYYDGFNGTSAATPLAAGIGALVVTAKPTLTWAEARDILTRTALRTDLRNTDIHPATPFVPPTPNVPSPLPASPAIDGRWTNRQGDPIVDNGGSMIRFAERSEDVDAQPTETTLVLDDVDDMHVDHAVVLTNQAGTASERRIITAVDVPTKTITVDAPLVNNYVGGGANTGRDDLAADAAKGATIIQVNSTASFVVGQTIEINSFLHSAEVRHVRGIPDATHLEIDPLERDVHNNENVYGGLIADRSPWYGAGRLDAEAAVRAAFNYSHDARDLMIRNNIHDNGTAPVNLAAAPIASPDIWGRLTAPVIAAGLPGAPGDGDNALPEGYKFPGYDPAASYQHLASHLQPKPGQDYYVYARIKNRGDSLYSLDAWARVYIYRSRSEEPFRIPQGWNDASGPANIMNNNSGTFLLGTERPLFNAAADESLPALTGGIAPGDHFIVKAMWPAANVPTAASLAAAGIADQDRLRTHLLVEITPHDGLLAGDTVGNNNNISSREVTFAAVTFKKGNGDPLPDSLTVKRDNTVGSLAFTVNLKDPVGYFRVGKVKVVGERSVKSGVVERVEWSWSGAGPAWTSNPAAPTWFTVGAPTLPGGGAAAAANDAVEINFSGTFDASALHDVVDINLQLYSHDDVLLLEQFESVFIDQTPVRLSDLDVVDPNAPSLYTFADMAGLTQTTAFGPESDKVFRVTSSFNVAAGTKAYAVTAGEVMVQRVWTADSDAGGYQDAVVNLILKPFDAPRIGSRAVKYFVYRGIRLGDLLKSKDDPTHVRDEAGGSEFIAALYRYQLARHNAFLATAYGQAHQGEAPPLTLTSDILGWDVAVASNTALDPMFFGSDTAPQLPITAAGMQLGEFTQGTECGFEVVLEANASVHTYEFARRPLTRIDVSADAAKSLALRHHREEVLRYLDPAAYYGQQYSIGVYAKSGGTKTLKKEDALYTDVLAPFTTRNTLYIDIRNETDASFNFYANYAINGSHLMYGVKPGKKTMNPKSYGTKGWPLMILKRTQADRAVDKIYLALSMSGNKVPALYIECGSPATPVDGTAFVIGGKLYNDGAQWTKEVGFTIRQHAAGGGAKEDVAGIILLAYGRRVDSTKLWPAHSTVLKFEQYTDNVFGPVNALVPWHTDPANVKTKWVRLNDLRFVDGTDNDPALGFGSVAERGAAFQPSQVVFFNAALGYFMRKGGAANVVVGTGIEGGFSPQPNLFSASSLFYGFDLKTTTIREVPAGGGAAVAISLLTLASSDQASVPESVMLLGLHENEYNTLIGLAGLSDNHPKNIVLTEQLPGGGATHQNDGTTDYHRYAVTLRGLDDATAESTDVAPPAPILVYSLDGLIFVSPSFDSTKLIPDTYTPDHEESRSMGKPELEARIAADSDITTKLNLFIDAVNQVTAGSATAKADLAAAVFQYGADILTAARTNTITPAAGNTYHEDRALYWARLRMAVALKGNAYCMKNAADRDELVHDLELLSRGLSGVTFSGGNKRILLLATDPIGLNVDITASNPSAVAALGLQGTVTNGTVTADVKTAILPIRYRDFAAGVLEDLVKPLLYPRGVDMIVLLSQNGSAQYFEVERFAGLKSGANRDNNDNIDLTPLAAGAGFPEFFETSLPVSDMMHNQTTAHPQIWYYDQSYTQSDAAGHVTSVPHPMEPGGSNRENNDPLITLAAITGASVSGSAGDFIPNQIFYRLMRLCATPPPPYAPSDVKVGAVSIPTPAASGRTMSQIVDEVRNLLVRALDGL